MHATIRRYEGVDTARTEELSRKVSETLVPQLEKIEGFRGYYLVESGNGVVTSVGLFAGLGPERRGNEPRGRLGEGAEARVRAAQRAANHERQGDRAARRRRRRLSGRQRASGEGRSGPPPTRP